MKKQSGRSMVEMLGTLAIIGVLSVTALTGYKIAMTKNRTNNILYDVNLAMNEIATREYMSLPTNASQISNLGVRTELDIVYGRNGGTESSGFFIQVNGVTEDVCKTLTSNKTAFMSSIQPYSGNAKADACAEGIDVRAEFQYPPVENESSPSVTCPAGQASLNGVCYDEDDICGEGSNAVYCSNGYCDKTKGTCCYEYEGFYECCEAGKVLNGDDVTGIFCCSPTQFYDANTYSCQDCPENATCNGSGNISGCVLNEMGWGTYYCCLENEIFTGYGCEECPIGYICNGTLDPIGCTNGYIDNGDGVPYCCSTSQYYDGDSCQDCPEGYICDGTNYKCNAEYYMENGECLPCPDGYTCDGINIGCPTGYAQNTYDGEVYCCPSNQYFTPYMPDKCLSCPEHGKCNGTEEVTCDAGYEFNDGAAQNGYTVDGYGCCNKETEYFRSGGGGCTECPDGVICDGTSNVVCSEGTWIDWPGCCADDDWNCIE